MVEERISIDIQHWQHLCNQTDSKKMMTLQNPNFEIGVWNWSFASARSKNRNKKNWKNRRKMADLKIAQNQNRHWNRKLLKRKFFLHVSRYNWCLERRIQTLEHSLPTPHNSSSSNSLSASLAAPPPPQPRRDNFTNLLRRAIFLEVQALFSFSLSVC